MIARKTLDAPLLAGAAEVEITPPVGTPLAGSLEPRVSIGTDDPLYVKTIVLESGGHRLALVAFDLISLTREVGDAGVAMASRATGIPPGNIVWAATHTHTGPYTSDRLGDGLINREWLAAIPARMAECVAAADRARIPAGFCRLRTFHCGLGQNRRITLKNGQAINNWNLGQLPADLQTAGTSGPIDPEIGILSIDDSRGKLSAVVFNFAQHTNTNFGPRFSGDYPAVVAARLRERFGPQVITLFLPGACGDINTTGPSYRHTGDALAVSIISALEGRRPEDAPLKLSAAKQEISVPRRDFSPAEEQRIADSGWNRERQQYFIRLLEILRREGKKEDVTVLQAWSIGAVGFASLPGELFVEWGLKIKRESPFAWTYPVELGGDCLGYLVTRRALEEGGYEPLGKISPPGVEIMVKAVIQMLKRLCGEDGP